MLESNARFVQWSDGSLQLLVGEEVFDINAADTPNHIAYSMTHDKALGQRSMEAQAMIKQSMQFRPTGINSSAHREMEVKVKRRMLKSVKVKTMVVDKDPELAQDERMRTIDGSNRVRQRQQRGNRRRPARVNKQFLEEDDEGVRKKTSLKHIKQATRSALFGEDEDASDSSSEEDEDQRYRTRTKARGGATKRRGAFPSDDEDEDSSNSESSDEEESDTGASKKRKAPIASKAAKRSKVLDDDSDDSEAS